MLHPHDCLDSASNCYGEHLVDAQGVDVEGALGGDVQAAEALVVGDAQAGEGLIVVQVEPVDAHIQVAAEEEANGGGGQHPVVGQHASIVGSRLQAWGKGE